MHLRILFFSAFIGYAPTILAHGDIHDRIHDLDHEIAENPGNAALLVERGRLYLDAGHADDARKDLIKAMQLEGDHQEARYRLAKAYLMLRDSNSAFEAAQSFVDKASNDVAKARGLLLIGDIYSASNKALEAAQAYRRAIELLPEITPDHVLAAAEAFHAAGRTHEAILTLDHGIERLGPLHALNERALMLEMENMSYQSALQRIDRMLETGQRIPFLLYKKGLILKAQSRENESRQAFLEALAKLDTSKRRHATLAYTSLRSALLAQIE